MNQYRLQDCFGVLVSTDLVPRYLRTRRAGACEGAADHFRRRRNIVILQDARSWRRNSQRFRQHICEPIAEPKAGVIVVSSINWRRHKFGQIANRIRHSDYLNPRILYVTAWIDKVTIKLQLFFELAFDDGSTPVRPCFATASN